MYKGLLKKILANKEYFVPSIFTEKQFKVLGKYDKHLPLSNAEKKALYTSIKKKMEALSMFAREQKDTEYWVNSPDEILPGRLKEAKKLIDHYSKKYDRVFISGSFLYSKDFKDIDVFIVRKRGYKEVEEKDRHIIFLSEKKLSQPAFQTAASISVSNFIIPRKLRKIKPSLSDIMAIYHEAIIERMRREKKPEAIRNLIFYHELFCKDHLVNPKQLRNSTRTIKINEIDKIMKELCKGLFSKTYLYVQFLTYIKTLKKAIKSIKRNDHLIRYKNTYQEIINERRRSKAEAA